MSSAAMTRHCGGVRLWTAILNLGLALPVAAQAPVPSPTPPPIRDQDALDFQGRAGVALGSGARAFGMGGAFLARADDATAASWNPAGLSYLRRPELSLVGARNGFTTTTRGAGDIVTFEDRSVGYTPDFLSIAYPFELRSISGAAQISFQRVISFRGERRIERLGNLPLSLEAQGGFDVLALGTGVQVSRKVRVGGTLNRWLRGYRQILERPGPRQTRQEVDFSLSAWNVNLGLLWTPLESLNLGAVAKSPFTGNATLARTRRDRDPIRPSQQIENSFSSGDVTLEFPGALGMGVSWRPRSPLTLSADYTRTSWSTGRVHGFFTLAPTGPPEVFDDLPYPTLDDPDQQDTEQTRVGIEYVLIRDRVKWPFRVGYFNDRQYFRAGDGQPPRFDGLTAGTGILAGPVLFDIAYIHEIGRYTDAANGRAQVKIRRLFMSMIYRHGVSR